MRFLLDENFPKAASLLLEELGHECLDVRGSELEGKEDELLLAEAVRTGSVLLTTDRDFFHTLQHTISGHSGIVVVALKKPNRQAILERLKWLILHVSDEDFRDRAFQLRDRTWVAYPPMPQER